MACESSWLQGALAFTLSHSALAREKVGEIEGLVNWYNVWNPQPLPGAVNRGEQKAYSLNPFRGAGSGGEGQ